MVGVRLLRSPPNPPGAACCAPRGSTAFRRAAAGRSASRTPVTPLSLRCGRPTAEAAEPISLRETEARAPLAAGCPEWAAGPAEADPASTSAVATTGLAIAIAVPAPNIIANGPMRPTNIAALITPPETVTGITAECTRATRTGEACQYLSSQVFAHAEIVPTAANAAAKTSPAGGSRAGHRGNDAGVDSDVELCP